MGSIWSGLGQAMMKVKEAIYAVLPQLMTFLGDAWIILIPFGIFVIIKILNFSVLWLKDFNSYILAVVTI
ncbi:hypothetical protein [Spiroplasma poulsonii]|uniref:hypothetical protein n=1 Tax=Spiroplasma poulsonii TaxID=2138 RepID=UPI001F4CDBF5|nr:hypothetical protein [Spiroplasma poulsonii]UNF62509.1 hypothetical protein MNU24_03370 [Spiroplasma poulsonii]